MFVQIIRGRVSDAESLRRLQDRWDAEVKPGAIGFLGGTGGIAADGTFIMLARFDSEKNARANSDRPEQGAWWAEVEKCFAATPTFDETTEVQEMMGGGSDDAGFVQVIAGRILDREGASFTEDDEAILRGERPEILGGLVCLLDGGTRFVQAVYFTNEGSARKGESAEPSEAAKALMERWQSAIADVEYIDLTDPVLTTA